ncbi:MAG TPA: BTAD domain-containing putative transcriptional regulator [Gaiellaceae bacterium]
MAVEFRVLGPLEIRRDGTPVRPRGRKQKILLGVLLVEHGRAVSTDRLIDELWPGGAPAGARHALEMQVSRLRSLLGSDSPVLTRAPGYALEIDPQILDSVRFEEGATEAREALPHDPPRAATRATDALALWRGNAYSDVAYESFAQGEISRLEELRLETEELRVEAELALGHAGEMVGDVEALVAATPLRERRHALLMRVLYLAGRQADALSAYREARSLLRDELGIEPGDELRATERAILQQDPALTAPRTAQAQQSAGERRHVTIVAVEPSVSLDLDPEEHDLLIAEAAGVVERTAEHFDARQIEQFVLAFAQEDHVARGHAAADELRNALEAHVGIESGEALIADASIRGPVVERARREARAGTSNRPVLVVERHFDGQFVNRIEALAALRRARSMLVVGPPGIGKSRLLHELARTESVHVGRCTSYGSSAIAPLREVVASFGEPAALDGAPAAEVALAFRRICSRAPDDFVAIDDVQWADDVVVDTVAQLARHGGRVICLARDELLDEKPDVLSVLERLAIEPLSADDSAVLAAGLGAPDETVVARAEGNPLFIEQLLAHASEAGEALPSTLSALLAARLDRLSPGERRVIGTASVIGRDFDDSLVAELLQAARPRKALAGLVRRGLLEPIDAEAAFDERFRFRHALIREAAYEATPKVERSRLHELLARFLETRGAGDELVGFHFARAAEVAVGNDPRRAELAETAGRRLGAAALDSFKLGYAAHAAALFGRAATLLPADDEERRELLCERSIALTAAGDRAHAREALREAHAAATRAGDRRIRLRAEIEQAVLQQMESAPASARLLAERTEQALPVFADAGDERSLGRALLLRGWMEGGVFGRCRVWHDTAEEALLHYRRIGFPSSTCVTQIASALYHGPTPVQAASARLEELLTSEVDDLIGEAAVRAHIGGLYAMAGAHDGAAEALARARGIYEELDRPEALLLICEPLEADAGVLAGETDRVVALLEKNCNGLRERGLWLFYATRAALLADVLLGSGNTREAAHWATESRERAVEDDVWSQIAWRAIQARLEDNPALAHEALALARTTDLVDLEARALVAAGDPESLAAAVRAYEAKGNVAAAARVAAATLSDAP